MTDAETIAALIQTEFESEGARRAGIEQRAQAVITSAGVIVALALGFAGLALQAKHPQLGALWKGLLLGSLSGFVVAILLGLAANWPARYNAISVGGPRGLAELVDGESSSSHGQQITREIGVVRVNQINQARATNSVKARLLAAALLVEVVAVALLAVFTGEVVLTLL